MALADDSKYRTTTRSPAQPRAPGPCAGIEHIDATEIGGRRLDPGRGRLGVAEVEVVPTGVVPLHSEGFRARLGCAGAEVALGTDPTARRELAGRVVSALAADEIALVSPVEPHVQDVIDCIAWGRPLEVINASMRRS